jgi:hypothetical protein
MNDKKVCATTCKLHHRLFRFLCSHKLFSSAMAMLGAMYTFYTFPITAATALIEPDEFAGLIPAVANVEEQERYQIALLLAGLVSALIWSTFFALCPVFFKVRWIEGFIGQSSHLWISGYRPFWLKGNQRCRSRVQGFAVLLVVHGADRVFRPLVDSSWFESR